MEQPYVLWAILRFSGIYS